MTAEEILNKFDLDFPSEYDREYYTNQILQAMEQYRNEGLREELIKAQDEYITYLMKLVRTNNMIWDISLGARQD